MADSEFTNLYLEGGYQGLHYDNGSDYNNAQIDQLNLSASDAASVQSVLQDNENLDSYYIKFEIDNRPSEFFRHRLMFSKTAELGFDSNFYELWNVEYDADWKVFDHVELGPTIFYEHTSLRDREGKRATVLARRSEFGIISQIL